MKNAGSILLFLLFILVFNTSINAQQKPQTILQGTELLVPFSKTIIDSTSWVKLGKEALMKVEKLICTNKNYKVISFTFMVELRGDIVTTKGSGNVFTPEMKKTINNLNSGDRVWIQDISSKGPDGKVEKLQNICFKIE
jgi:hypothetical protein